MNSAQVDEAKTHNDVFLDNFDIVRLVLFLATKEDQVPEGTDRIFKQVTKLQKLVFLAQYGLSEFETLVEKKLFLDPYGLIKYQANNFGPYSVDLEIICSKLKQNKELDIQKQGKTKIYIIKPELIEKLKKKANLLNDPDIKIWAYKVQKKTKMSLNDLLTEVYNDPRFDELLTESLIKSKFKR